MQIPKKMVAYQIAIAILMLLGLEGLCRIAHTFSSTSASEGEEWVVRTPGLGWERRPNYKGPDICGISRASDARGLLPFDAAQLEETNPEQLTVLFIGDSNTYGYCLEADSTFVEVADRALPHFKMINLGVPAYTSYQGYKALLKYGEIIKPDIVVASFNFNDRRYVVNGDDIDSERKFAELARSSHFLEQIYLFRLARLVSRKIGLMPDDAPGKTRPVRLDTLRPRVDEQRYRSILGDIARWAREHGSGVYFLLLGDAPDETELLRTGVKYLEEANHSAAIKPLEALKQRPRAALAQLAQLYLSKAYARAGETRKAEEIAWVQPAVSAHGGHPIRLDTYYNLAMREVADKYGIPLIDAQAALEKRPDVFFDSCHFDAQGHEIVGKLIADVLMKANVLAAETANTSRVRR
jgi:lysophospholipase L1-like esterase